MCWARSFSPAPFGSMLEVLLTTILADPSGICSHLIRVRVRYFAAIFSVDICERATYAMPEYRVSAPLHPFPFNHSPVLLVTSLSLNKFRMSPQHPLIDKPAPSFSIPDSNGDVFKFPPEEEGKRIEKPIALFFYPSAGQPCPWGRLSISR